jgi:branched-chain amino acid transport system permease protein
VIYRETGDFKTSYAEDLEIFSIPQDKMFFWGLLAFAYLVVPFIIDSYWASAILVPFLVYSFAAIGLNILVGYCGQVSLGTGGFMAVGAYSAFKLMTAYPGLDMFLVVLASGVITAGVGMMFGLPSLRIKGFYLAVATLAAQFFLVWLFTKVPWFFNNSATGQITAPTRTALGVVVTGPDTQPWAAYLFCLILVTIFGFVAKNLLRGRMGRSWMAIRDMDIAAQIIGVDPMKAKLSAFGISSFFVGMAGALYFAVWFGSAEPSDAFSILLSFDVLFMIIIGGLGSMIGSFFGAAFIVLLPILLKNLMVGLIGIDTSTAAFTEIALLGAFIIFFLIMEPHGLARLWSITKERLRLWPFPY